MRINKAVFLLGVSVISALSACSPMSDEQVSKNGADDIVPKEYEDALIGKKVIQTPDGAMSINEFEDSEDNLYCFSDVDGDDCEELIIHGRLYFYVIKRFDDDYRVIYDGRNYDRPIDMNECHGIFYYKLGAAPYHETYMFYTMSSDIEGTEVIYASWYDEDEDGEMEDTDWFFLDSYEENKVSKDEWLKAIQDYFPLKEVEIEWKKFGN